MKKKNKKAIPKCRVGPPPYGRARVSYKKNAAVVSPCGVHIAAVFGADINTIRLAAGTEKQNARGGGIIISEHL